MEILFIHILLDGQPILTIKEGNQEKKYTFCDDATWYYYPEYEMITDSIKIARLTENMETIVSEKLNFNRATGLANSDLVW